MGKSTEELLTEVADILCKCKELKERIVSDNHNESLNKFLSTHLVLGLKKK